MRKGRQGEVRGPVSGQVGPTFLHKGRTTNESHSFRPQITEPPNFNAERDTLDSAPPLLLAFSRIARCNFSHDLTSTYEFPLISLPCPACTIDHPHQAPLAFRAPICNSPTVLSDVSPSFVFPADCSTSSPPEPHPTPTLLNLPPSFHARFSRNGYRYVHR